MPTGGWPLVFATPTLRPTVSARIALGRDTAQSVRGAPSASSIGIAKRAVTGAQIRSRVVAREGRTTLQPALQPQCNGPTTSSPLGRDTNGIFLRLTLIAMKDELLALARYAAFVGVITICLSGGLLWLLAPDPSHKVEPQPPVIPQKILDSIERKKPVPVQASPIAEAAKPVMAEVPVALSPAPPRKLETIRELKVTKRKAKRRASPTRPTMSAPASISVVTTGRTDFPY